VGATIETTPIQMTAVTFDPSASTNTQIVLLWTALTGSAAGGVNVAITDY
jgi:hypothetical protein